MVLAGANFALTLPGARPAAAATRGSGRGAPALPRACSSLGSIVLAVELWTEGIAERRGGDPARRLPGRLDDDDDRLRERRLRRSGRRFALMTLVGADVRRRLAPARRAARSRSCATCCSASSLRRELRQTAAPGGRDADPAQRRRSSTSARSARSSRSSSSTSGSSSSARACIAHRRRVPGARRCSVRRDRRRGDDARQRRARARLRRPDGLVRALQRRLDARHDRR